MANVLRAELEPIGVSLPVVQILRRIASGGDLSQLELAQELELEPGALSRLLTDLEEQRLVTRRRDPNDKRRVLMTSTAAATSLLTRAQPRMLAGLNGMFSRLTRVEQDDLRRLLEKLGQCEDQRSTAPRPPRRRPV